MGGDNKTFTSKKTGLRIFFPAHSWESEIYSNNRLLLFAFQEKLHSNIFLYTKLSIPHRQQESFINITSPLTLPYSSVLTLTIVLYKYPTSFSVHHLSLLDMYQSTPLGNNPIAFEVLQTLVEIIFPGTNH